MPSDHTLSLAAQAVRRHDRERFVTALFAPPGPREDLMVLYAFNLEVARIRESVHEAMAGMIRLQWWREVVSGLRDDEAARNPVAGPLVALIRHRRLPLETFELLLEAREGDLSNEAPADLDSLERYAQATAGSLGELAAVILGADASPARAVGTAFALTGLLRAVPVHLPQGRLMLPVQALEEAGTSPEQVLAGKAGRATIAAAARPVGERARALLAEARRAKPSRAALPALLPGTQASAHLRVLEQAGWDVFDPRIPRPRPMPLRLAVNALLGRF